MGQGYCGAAYGVHAFGALTSFPRVQPCAATPFASKFFEHFVQISYAMNTSGGTGLWDDQDGFYYDQITEDGNEPQCLRGASGMATTGGVARAVLTDVNVSS